VTGKSQGEEKEEGGCGLLRSMIVSLISRKLGATKKEKRGGEGEERK